MSNPVRIVTVSYLNTQPFIEGLQRHFTPEEVIIELAHPAKCAEAAVTGSADLVLVPVGALPELPNHRLLPGWCIGAEGPVRTVAVYSEVPLEECESVFLDYQSRTSVLLAQMVIQDYLKLPLRFEPAYPHFEAEISGNKAGLVIGDRTFQLDDRYPFKLDLGKAWTEWTGLPFAFAVWVELHPLDASFKKRFDEAVSWGVNHVVEFAGGPVELEYFEKYISYPFDGRKQQALKLFLAKAAHLVEGSLA